jgi:hypothetical protein
MAEDFELNQRQRLRDDFEFYARNCLSIRTKEGGISPFVLNEAQQYIHSRLEEQRSRTGKVRAIVLKGRQQGASTLIGGRYYWRTTHRPGVRTFILTHDAEATANLFSMTDRYHQHCPQFVKPAVGAANAKELTFPLLDSEYKVGTAGTKAVGRGSTITYFHGSEVAFWPNADEHVKGVMQAVPDADDTEIILESTANGMGNFFHQQWKKAEAGESEYQAIFVPWYWQPEYSKTPPKDFIYGEDEEEIAAQYGLTKEQIYWRRQKIVELSTNGADGERAFKQEYPCNAAEAFQITGRDGLIKPEVVMRARKAEVKGGSGPLVVGVDPSRGGDRFSVIKRQHRKAYDLKSYHGDQVDALGKSVAICKAILDTICPIAGRKPDMMFIDAGGGADLVDRLHELGYRGRVKAVAFGSSPLEPAKWRNKRTEMWGLANLWLKDEHMPVQIPDSDTLHADLCASFYDRDSNDVIALWRKDRIKEEIGFSPDEGDALALTFAEPAEYFDQDDEDDEYTGPDGRSSVAGY